MQNVNDKTRPMFEFRTAHFSSNDTYHTCSIMGCKKCTKCDEAFKTKIKKYIPIANTQINSTRYERLSKFRKSCDPGKHKTMNIAKG